MSRRVQIRHHRGLEPCTEAETPAAEDADSSPVGSYTGNGWEADDSFIRGRLEEGVPAFVSEGLANEGIRRFTLQVGTEMSRLTAQYLPPTPGLDAARSRHPYQELGSMSFDIEYDILRHRYILGCTLGPSRTTCTWTSPLLLARPRTLCKQRCRTPCTALVCPSYRRM